MNKSKKGREGIVYSTNSDFEYNYASQEEHDTLPASKQQLKISLDKSGRAGKQVTLISGYTGKTGDLEVLAKILKTKCGTGGSVKDREILIQGDVRDKVTEILTREGYRTKRVG
jgi:translation initiation factor 1